MASPSERAAEAELTRKLKQLMDKVALETLARLAESNAVPGDEAARRLILQPFSNAGNELARITDEDAIAAAERGRNKIIDTLRKMGDTGVTFSKTPVSLIEQARESVFVASQRTMDRLIGAVQPVLAQGFEGGLGTREVAGMLRGEFDNMMRHELGRVARTEIQSLQNVGAQQTMQEYGVEYQMWRTAEDDRVRESHQELEGEITALDTPFSNGLRYPLDETGPLEEWINCRCRAIPFIVPPGLAAPNDGPFFETDLVPAVVISDSTT